MPVLDPAIILAALDPEQRAAAQLAAGPVCIVAGAGTGKTRTVTHRIAYAVATGVVPAQQVLALTHSRKAAGELVARLHILGVAGAEARTFHAAALRICGRYWKALDRPGDGPRLLSGRERWTFLRAAIDRALGRPGTDDEVRDFAGEADWCGARGLSPAGWGSAARAAGRDPGLDDEVVVAAIHAFGAAKRQAGRVDFADLIDLAAGLLEADGPEAAEIRGRWAHLTVDEYQDVDPSQQRFLEAIAGPHGSDICAVGDVRQAIYGFKGGDDTYLLGFGRRWPGARVVTLTRNYRSTPEIVGWANRLARRLPAVEGAGAAALRASRPSAAAPRIHTCADEQAEEQTVVRLVREALKAGTLPSGIAVLYRFNAMSARFEQALTAAGVRYRVADDGSFFERAEVREVLVPFGQRARAEPDAGGLAMLGAELARAGWDPDKPPPGHGAALARHEAHSALAGLARGLEGAGEATARTLLAGINRLASAALDPPESGIWLGTLHRAKGLEWDVVIIAGATDGALPSAYAETPAEEEEERRLLYVGMTRARDRLHLTWAGVRGNGRPSEPSPYLAELSPTGLVRERARRPGRPAVGQPATTAKSRPRPAERREGFDCPACGTWLVWTAARRLGRCWDCLLAESSPDGDAARAAWLYVQATASETGVAPDVLCAPKAVMALVAERPDDPGWLVGRLGVGVDPGPWGPGLIAAVSNTTTGSRPR